LHLPQAKAQFNAAVHTLYEDCVKPYYESVSLDHFRGCMVLKGKQRLNRERQIPPA
jgi:hypothetical protein